MTTFRDQVMDALLARLRLKCGTTFLHYSRRFMTWDQMVQNLQESRPIRQPALFLYDGIGLGGGMDNVDSRSRATPSVVTLRRTIVIYNRFPGGTIPSGPDAITPGGTIFYPLIESIEDNAMVSDTPSQNALTLGGLVSHCEIVGDIHYVTPDIDPSGQGMCTVPVSIMLLPKSR